MEDYRNPGDIEIRTFKFMSSAGQIIDIEPLVVEFSMYQDLLTHYMRCELVINDSVGLINTLLGNKDERIMGGFTGGEALFISYKSRSEDLEYKNHVFGLYNLSDRIRVDTQNETYMISGISIEAYQTKGVNISRSFGHPTGSQISSMVGKVVNEFVYNDNAKGLYRNYTTLLNIDFTKNVDIGETNGLHKYVIPNLTVDQTLDFLSSESDCDGHVPYYIFFEDSNGFRFQDVNALLMTDAKETYSYSPTVHVKDENDQKRINDYQKIMNFAVLRQTDILDAVDKGLYKSKTISLDVMGKKTRKVVFDYEKEGSKFQKLQPFNIPGSSSGDGFYHVTTTQLGHEQHPVLKSDNPLPKKIDQFSARKRSFRRQVFNTVLEVTIPGDSERNVGDLINLNIPVASNNEESKISQRDKYLSGKYIITKIRHKYNPQSAGNQFITVLQCTKDTGIEV